MNRALALMGLLILSAPAAQAADWSQPETVTVTTKEYEFSPKRLVFKRGVAYRLHDGYVPSRVDCDLNIGLLFILAVYFALLEPGDTVLGLRDARVHRAGFF